MTDSSNREYHISSNYFRTAAVADIQLSISKAGLSRKILRTELLDNPKNSDHSVKSCIVHQRRNKATDDWEDLPGPDLTDTTASLPSKFPLDSAETWQLFGRLADLYHISKDGITHGQVVVHLANEDEIIKTDASRARLIRKILESDHGEEVWKLLLQLQPDLGSKLANALKHHERIIAVEQFEANIGLSHNEDYWKAFLRQNSWMFGGSNVSLVDESRLDIKNIADLPFRVDGGFMDIVELKRPDTPFWMRTTKDGDTTYLYRGKYPVPFYELSGAIAQVSNYVLQAEKHVTDTDFLKTHEVTPLKPRGLVIHGRSAGWTQVHWDAFRLLNDNLHGVQVMTFDHLLAQARRAVDY